MFHRRVLIIAVVTVSFWPPHPFAGAITTPPSWKPRERVADTLVDYTDHRGSDRTLAYDHHGNPGIAFFDHLGGDLRYARRVPGVGWTHSVVDSQFSVGLYPSLAYDRYERPAISYFDESNGYLKYAHFDGSMWNVETADMSGVNTQYTSLAFDLLGRPAIAYSGFGPSLSYIADTDGDFSLVDESPVTIVNEFTWHPSLVFDSLNRPMIAHFSATSNVLRFSIQEPGLGWITTTLDGVPGEFPSIAIDPDTGYPAIASKDIITGELHYAAWDGDSWNVETIDSTGSSQFGFHPSLAFDPADGNPAISYVDFANDDLKLAWHDGIAWQTQTVDAVGAVGYASSLAFNDFGTGFPSIAYFTAGGGGNAHLYFIEDPPAIVPEPASLAVLAFGLVPVLIRRRTARR